MASAEPGVACGLAARATSPRERPLGSIPLVACGLRREHPGGPMDTTLNTDLPAEFDLATAKWVRYAGSPKFDYPIDYAISVVDVDVAAGRIDFLASWAPNSYCHYHRHLGTTAAVVIAGEQHLTETRPFETVTKVRRAGFKGRVPDGESHMECAGPDGLTMLFSVHAPDGRIFEVLDAEGNVLVAATIAEFLATMQDEAA